jgi:uncharacterized NAD(P)/FAD-binding protein YdhS
MKRSVCARTRIHGNLTTSLDLGEKDEHALPLRASLPVTATVAIVGAGFAGTLTAAQLLRAATTPLRVVLIERRGRFGPGVAYSTADERHLLNVVAERMSALPDEPDHFVTWARSIGREVPDGAYLPRALYGDYLRALLAHAEWTAPADRTIARIQGEAVDVERGDRGATVVLADGSRIEAQHVVLALGGIGGQPPVALPEDPRVVADPWTPGALPGPLPATTTLLVGSGLTAVDVALSVCAREDASRVVAISRGGCLPFDQLPGLREPVAAPPLPAAPATVEALERWLRRHVWQARRAGRDWRDALDGVRPHVPRLWQSLPLDERRRFARERSRAWELRRHRMAPEIAAQVRALLRSGRLVVRAGSIVAVRALDRTVEVLVSGGREELRTLRVDRVVMCAGPGGDVRAASSPLVRALLDRGLARPDTLSLGLSASDDGALVAADGREQPWLHLLGPLRRGELWETTAVGEIRGQAQCVAQAVARQTAAQQA